MVANSKVNLCLTTTCSFAKNCHFLQKSPIMPCCSSQSVQFADLKLSSFFAWQLGGGVAALIYHSCGMVFWYECHSRWRFLINLFLPRHILFLLLPLEETSNSSVTQHRGNHGSLWSTLRSNI